MPRFDPSFFTVRTVLEARARILTPEDSTTDTRWRIETPYLGELIMEHLALRPDHRVLDFGCGIGRLAKEMIDRSGCAVVGADTSVTMQCQAPAYVQSERFFSCHPAALSLGACSSGVHHAVAVWSLQHIPNVDAADGAIALIHRSLRSGGKLFVVNNHKRALPIDEGRWYDDGKDVRELLGARFQEVSHGTLDVERTTPVTSRAAFWGVYQRRN